MIAVSAAARTEVATVVMTVTGGLVGHAVLGAELTQLRWKTRKRLATRPPASRRAEFP